jgi:hypothetical protein
VSGKVVLVVEDGTEYVDAFRLLAGADSRSPGLELVRAADVAEARRTLEDRRIDGVFLDVVFDRTPPEKLCGDSNSTRERSPDHLANQQGFYLAAELAGLLAGVARVVIAYDFANEPGRLAALRERVPTLEGVEDGTPLSRVLARLASD